MREYIVMSVHDIATDTRNPTTQPDHNVDGNERENSFEWERERKVKKTENELFLLQLLKYDDNLLRIFGAQFSLKWFTRTFPIHTLFSTQNFPKPMENRIITVLKSFYSVRRELLNKESESLCAHRSKE